MAVFAPALTQIWESAKAFDIDPDALFRSAGIDPSLRLDGNARVSEKQLDQLLFNARQQSHDEQFAFKVADKLHPSYLGAIGYAWLTSATLRKAFQRLERFNSMIIDELTIHLEDRDDELWVIFESDLGKALDPAMRERTRLAMAVKLCKLNCGDLFAPVRLHFQHEEPANAAVYYSYFKCEICFGQAQTALVLPQKIMDTPLPGFDAHLVTMHDKMIVDYLAKMNKLDIIGRTSAMILEHLPSGEISVEEVASNLNLSVRTLRRKLKQDGQTYKGLIAEIRQDLGEKYIHDKTLTITEISFLLGFSDTSSFSRAYRTWTGQSPSSARAVGARSASD